MIQQFYHIILQGIYLLEDLAQKHSEGNRDYVYYLAIGNARLKNYSVALKFCKAFLQIEPNNQQAITLEVIYQLISIFFQLKFYSIDYCHFTFFLNRSTYGKRWKEKQWQA